VSNDDVAVLCQVAGDGYLCHVVVGMDAGATHHEVTFTNGDLSDLGGNTTDPETLVRESFAFLLEREPRESILVRFDLPVIGRYFPEYPAEIQKRLNGAA
jgi:hypothetical protein